MALARCQLGDEVSILTDSGWHGPYTLYGWPVGFNHSLVRHPVAIFVNVLTSVVIAAATWGVLTAVVRNCRARFSLRQLMAMFSVAAILAWLARLDMAIVAFMIAADVSGSFPFIQVSAFWRSWFVAPPMWLGIGCTAYLLVTCLYRLGARVLRSLVRGDAVPG
jgi:hypothetical protein